MDWQAGAGAFSADWAGVWHMLSRQAHFRHVPHGQRCLSLPFIYASLWLCRIWASQSEFPFLSCISIYIRSCALSSCFSLGGVGSKDTTGQLFLNVSFSPLCLHTTAAQWSTEPPTVTAALLLWLTCKPPNETRSFISTQDSYFGNVSFPLFCKSMAKLDIKIITFPAFYVWNATNIPGLANRSPILGIT